MSTPDATVFAVDLGGTRLRTAAVRGGSLGSRRSVPTPRTIDQIVATIGAHFRAVEAECAGEIDAVGISALGPVLPHLGIIRNAPTLPDFDNVPLGDLVAEQIGRPVLVFNDANAATYGEWLLGAGRGVRDFCFVTLSTGIGAGLVVNGELVQGHRGSAGEFGRTRIRVPDEAGLVQLEHRASGTAIAARASRILAGTGHPGLQHHLEQTGEITAHQVAALAAEGDTVCLGIMREAATLLGERLADLTRLLDPEVIAIGGGVSRAGDCLWQPMLATMTAQLTEDQSHLPRVVPGELTDDAGLYGVALLTVNRTAESGQRPDGVPSQAPAPIDQ